MAIVDFNKNSIGGGGSGGGSGSDPNAVKYTAQSLTDAQKAQARTNIGATAPEILVAEYGVTTYDTIDSAYNAGKSVFCKYSDKIYALAFKSAEHFRFTLILAQYVYEASCDTSSNWSIATTGLERTFDKVSDIFANRESTTKYPSTKAVADYVNNSVPVVPVDTAIPSGGLGANVHYALGTLTGSVSITLDTTTEVSGQMNIYSLAFTAGSTAPTITWPSDITSWAGNCLDATTMAPVITGGSSYEVSIVDGMAVITEFVA